MDTWRTATRTDARIVDIWPRCGADVERCFFCDASARHFVCEPDEARGGRTLHVCDGPFEACPGVPGRAGSRRA